MNLKSFTKYLKQGISLTKKSLTLFWIDLALILPTYIYSFFQENPAWGFFPVIILILSVITVGFTVSLPYFLSLKQENTALQITDIFKTSFINIKRGFIQAFVLLLAFAILGNVLVLGAVVGLKIPFDEVMVFVQNLFRIQSWGFITLTIFLAFSTFVSVYFSVEKESLFSSIKKSITTSLKHYPFVILISALSMIIPFAGSFIASDMWFLLILQTLFARYFYLIITSAILIYYQKEVKN